MRYFRCFDSPLGRMEAVSDGEALTGLRFLEEGEIPAASPRGAEKIFEAAGRWLERYFHGEIPDFLPPLQLSSLPFRREVGEIMLTIPYGTTVSYGEIARIIARRRHIPRMAAQAVGGAVGGNPIAVIVPCHRVVGARGALTGYGGGMDRKIRLLRLEGLRIEGNSVIPGGDVQT